MFFKSFEKIRSWGRGDEATTAIEFSLLAVPFMTFVIGIIEMSIMFVGQALLQGAVADASRLIRTGQIQQAEGEDPEDIFREALCAHATALLNCNMIQFEVETLDSFDDADLEPDVDEEGNLTSEDFDPGDSNDIVLIRAIYLYPLMTPLIGTFFSDYAGNKKLLVSAVVLQTEPYDFEDD